MALTEIPLRWDTDKVCVAAEIKPEKKSRGFVWTPGVGGDPTPGPGCFARHTAPAPPRVPCAPRWLPACCVRAAGWDGSCVLVPPASASLPRRWSVRFPPGPGRGGKLCSPARFGFDARGAPETPFRVLKALSRGSHVYGVLLRDRHAGFHHRSRRRDWHRRRFLLRNRGVQVTALPHRPGQVFPGRSRGVIPPVFTPAGFLGRRPGEKQLPRAGFVGSPLAAPAEHSARGGWTASGSWGPSIHDGSY